MANIPKYMKSKYVIHLVDDSIVYAKEYSPRNNYGSAYHVVMINGEDRNDIKECMIPYCRIKYIEVKNID